MCKLTISSCFKDIKHHIIIAGCIAKQYLDWFNDDLVALTQVDSDSFTSDPDELLSSDESECSSPYQDDLFHSMLSKTGLHRPDEPPMLLDPTLLQAVLDKLLLDSRAVKSFMSGLATYLMDPLKVMHHFKILFCSQSVH